MGLQITLSWVLDFTIDAPGCGTIVLIGIVDSSGMDLAPVPGALIFSHPNTYIHLEQ